MRLLVDYLQAREPDSFEPEGLVAAITPMTIISWPAVSTLPCSRS